MTKSALYICIHCEDKTPRNSRDSWEHSSAKHPETITREVATPEEMAPGLAMLASLKKALAEARAERA